METVFWVCKFDWLVASINTFLAYFEWLKNLTNVRFGRLNRNWEESKQRLLLDSCTYGGKPLQLDEDTMEKIIKGPTEKDIVHSGLEETMIRACAETLETAREKQCSLRLATYVNALNRIQEYYDQAGLLFLWTFCLELNWKNWTGQHWYIKFLLKHPIKTSNSNCNEIRLLVTKFTTHITIISPIPSP